MRLSQLTACRASSSCHTARAQALSASGQQDDGGLVVDAPGREALAVEGALELGVEALGVLPHPVEAAVIGGWWRGRRVGTRCG